MTRYSLLNRILLSFFAKMVIIISLFSVFDLQMANAAEAGRSASGTITFRGAIVEGPCENHFNNGVMEMSCWSHGKTESIKSTPASFNKSGSLYLPDFKGKVSFEWIDHKKKIGLYKIIYN